MSNPELLLAATAVALTAVFQYARLYRARSGRRWQAVLNAYAAREIARDRRGNAPSP